MKRINIMTSCDDNLAKYILPQLVSIVENLRGYDVHFYLAHYRISPQNIKLIKEFAETLTDINFHEIKVVQNMDLYESIASVGGQLPCEAYFTLRVQDIVPEDVDRVLYIDAGDVIIHGDIAPYYFSDFESKSMIATSLEFKRNPVTGEKELYTQEDIIAVSKGILFNSGSYIINVEKFRDGGYTADDYLYLSNALKLNTETENMAYFGDRGFLAAAFVGDITFYDYPAHSDPSYMPYNFRSSYWGLFKGEPGYKPVILNYDIISKPWVVRFTDKDINEVVANTNFIAKHLIEPIPPITHMTVQSLTLAEVWWDYAKKTPIYFEADIKAKATADSWIKFYLPMCVEYLRAQRELVQLREQLDEATTVAIAEAADKAKKMKIVSLLDQARSGGLEATSKIVNTYSPDEILEAVAMGAQVPTNELTRYPVGVFTRTSEGKMENGTYLSSLREVCANIKHYEWMRSLLEDDTSKHVLDNLVLYRVYPNDELVKAAYDSENPVYFDRNIISTYENEVFVDCGAFDGDSILSYIKHCGAYKRIYAYELFDIRMADCRKKLAEYDNIVFRQVGVGEKESMVSFLDGYHMIRNDNAGKKMQVVSLDEDIEEPVTFIKMDVEGSEIEALHGAKGHIQRTKPKLAISIYHFETDFWEIPRLIHSLNPSYRFYLRHYHFQPPLPAINIETILYAI